jgi:hypothetical protein
VNPETDLDARFDELFEQVDTSGGFHHRDHVHLTWLAVRRYGAADATELIRHGIQKLARYANAPQKYHETVSCAWVVLVAHHVAAHDDPDFESFIERAPELLDKRLLMRFYRSTTLAAEAAKRGWVEPDLAPFPALFELPEK